MNDINNPPPPVHTQHTHYKAQTPSYPDTQDQQQSPSMLPTQNRHHQQPSQTATTSSSASAATSATAANHPPPRPDRTKHDQIKAKYRQLQRHYQYLNETSTSLKDELEKSQKKFLKLNQEVHFLLDQVDPMSNLPIDEQILAIDSYISSHTSFPQQSSNDNIPPLLASTSSSPQSDSNPSTLDVNSGVDELESFLSARFVSVNASTPSLSSTSSDPSQIGNNIQLSTKGPSPSVSPLSPPELSPS